MSDGSRVFAALKKSLKGLFPKMEGHEASHFGTLLHMITGMVASKHCHLPKIAGKIQSDIKQESQIEKFERWLANKAVNGNIYFLPFLERLLPTLINGTIKIILDGSVVGRDSACLMASIVYKNRTIPIAWLNIEGRKGHFTEDYHIEILKLIREILPKGSDVVIIGDGEFDGVDFLETIEDYEWSFVVRTSRKAHIVKDNEKVTLPTSLKEDECQSIIDCNFTQAHYGPVMILSWRKNQTTTIIYLVSNCQSPIDAKQHYKHRQKIETFFSDLKTKGFHLQKSHISDLARLANLMIAACIGYIWLVLLGKEALDSGAHKIFHRTDRCDLSLLQLGFRFLDYLLIKSLPIPKLKL